MLVVLKSETEKSMFGWVAVGHGVTWRGSHGRQGGTYVSTEPTTPMTFTYTEPHVGMVLLTKMWSLAFLI